MAALERMADIPSGLGADGEGPAEAADATAVRATATVTFSMPNRGLYRPQHAAAVGRLTIAASVRRKI